MRPYPPYSHAVFAVALLWLFTVFAPSAGEFDQQALGPTPDLTPAEVTRIQLEALRTNTLLNEGIALTYRFASPANRRTTGPLPRFVRMLRSPPYDRLLNHRAVTYGPLEIEKDTAYQPIVVTDSDGEQLAYLWVLSRQGDGEYRDCWMTDAVISSEDASEMRVAAVPVPANSTSDAPVLAYRGHGPGVTRPKDVRQARAEADGANRPLFW